MLFKTCPDCGASLDPAEKCDCQKEKNPPHANESGSFTNNGGSITAPNCSISDNTAIVNNFDLRSLRQKKNISAKDIIELVRSMFPGFDKTLHSKCENGDKYGITLKISAQNAIIMKHAPELMEKEKRRRQGNHKLTATVFCRVDNETHRKLHDKIRNEGWTSVQSWLTEIILEYLGGK